MVPKENVKMLEVVDMCGLGYACPQTQPDLVTPELPDLEERACELCKEYQNHKTTGSLPRGMLLDGDLSSCGHHGSYSSQKFTEAFMTQMGMKWEWVVLTHGLWYRVIPYPVRYKIRSIPCPHPENLHRGPRPW